MSADPLAYVLTQGADIVIRAGWKGARWLDGNGKPFDILAALAEAGKAGVLDCPVWIGRKKAAPLALRLIAYRKPADAAEKSRAKARQAAKREGYAISSGTLAAAEWVIRRYAGGRVIRTLGIRRLVVISRRLWIVHVPRHAVALPDLRAAREARRSCLPRCYRDLVKQDKCAGLEIRRIGYRYGNRSLSAIGRQVLRGSAVRAVVPPRWANNDDRAWCHSCMYWD